MEFKPSQYQHPFRKSIKKLITLQKGTGIESSTIINDEIMDDNNTSEKISSHKNSAKLIDHVCDYNGINLPNTE